MQPSNVVFRQCNPITQDAGRMRQERELKAEGDVTIMTVGLQLYQTVHSDNRPVCRFSSSNNEVCVHARDHTERNELMCLSFFPIPYLMCMSNNVPPYRYLSEKPPDESVKTF